MATRIQNRRDTAANWTANNPTLSDGEIGFETDTGKFKIGKSNTAWTSLQYAQVAGDDGLSYDIYPTVDSNGLVPPSNSGITMNNSSVGASYSIYGADTLFKAGDWIKLVYMDRPGGGGNGDNTIYPDVFVEGYIWEITKYPESNYNEYRFTATKINGGSQEGNIISEWTTGLLPEPKATYDFPPFIYPVGDPSAGLRSAPNGRPASAGEEYPILGQPGLYQVGQKIRMQGLDEFGVAIPGSYAVFEILGIQKYIEGVQTDGLSVRSLEVSEGASIPYSLSFSLHASDGPQGPGYEVTWDQSIHPYGEDVTTVWANIDVNKTSWAAGDLYNIPGDFSNSAFKLGSYVRYYFEDPTYTDAWYIEGWIRDISEIGGYAQVVVQRWSNHSDWDDALGQAYSPTPIFPAYFEPGYNFDKMVSISGGFVERAPDEYDYPSFTDAMNFNYPSMYFSGYHRGSYNPGDYVVISSRSNPGIKVFAYIGSIGYTDFDLGTFYIFPLEILAWDASEQDIFTDWTLSIASPPKKEYKLSKPLPLPWNSVDGQPAALPSLPPFARPAVSDIVSVFGDPGLFKVGDLVKAVSKTEPTAGFYGEITELGSASNSFTNQIEITDVSIWAEGNTVSYNNWELSLAGSTGLGYKVRAISSNWASGGFGISNWEFEEASAYQVGNRIRISDSSGSFEEGVISVVSGLNFTVTVESSSYDLASDTYHSVTIVGKPGLNGSGGNAGLGYYLIPNATYYGPTAAGAQAGTVYFERSSVEAYVIGSRVRATLLSDPASYVEGTLIEVSPGVSYAVDYDLDTIDGGSLVTGPAQWSLSVAGERGANGEDGIGYSSTLGTVPNDLTIGNVSTTGNSTQTFNFPTRLAYQIGDRIRISQASNYVEGSIETINVNAWGTPISYSTLIGIRFDAKGGSGTWIAYSTQLSISLATTNNSPAYMPFASQGFYKSPGANNSNVSATLNTTNFTHFYVGKTTTFDRIGFSTGSFTSAGSVRLGIYQDENGAPGGLVLNAGAASFNASNTSYLITINQTLAPGWYWLALNMQSGNSGFFGNAGNQNDVGGVQRMTSTSPFATMAVGYNQSSVTGVLPATAFGAFVTGNATPAAYLRAL
jgi:hypothetical protein